MEVALERLRKGLWWDRALTLVEGCTPAGEECENCWAIRTAQLHAPDLVHDGHWTERIRLRRDRLSLPTKARKPTTWAVWNDLFHEDVPADFILGAWETMSAADQHRFYVLTKRPDRMELIGRVHALSWWPNIWAGTTVGHPKHYDRLAALLQVPAHVRFLSCEPLLGLLDLRRIDLGPELVLNALDGCSMHHLASGMGLLDWVIAGAESGPNRRHTKLSWVSSLISQCKAAGVPVFVKQLEIDGRLSKDMDEWPEEFRIRQFPEG